MKTATNCIIGDISESYDPRRDIRIKIVDSLPECERLWRKFSSNVSLWDMWETAIIFYDKKYHKPFFIVADKNGAEQGILPLWYDMKEGNYKFFGGGFPENRRFWFKPEIANKIFEMIPKNTTLYDINNTVVKRIISKLPEFKDKFIENDFRHILNLKSINYDIQKYLAKFSKKHKKNLLYDLRRLNSEDCKLKWESMENFNKMVKLNKSTFGNESDFSDNDFVKQMKELLLFLKKEKMLHTLSIEINGVIEGVEAAAFYKGTYYVINGGYNKNIKNIGKLLIMEHIKRAIMLKANEVDFLASDTGWKEFWNLDKEQYFEMRK